MGFIDPDIAKALVTSGTGAGVGTLLKAVLKPESDLKRWLIQSATAIIVGTLSGAAVTEWMGFGQMTGLACSAVGALLSEQIIGFLQARGEGLKKGKLDVGVTKGDD